MKEPRHPWDLVVVNFFGPMKKSEVFLYGLVLIDAYMRFMVVIPTVDCTAITFATVFYNEICCRFGVPSRILSDRGSSFLNGLIEQLTLI
jgi:hypothetical protein